MKPRFRKREIVLARAAYQLVEQLEQFGKDLDGYLGLEEKLIGELKKSLRPYARLWEVKADDEQ